MVVFGNININKLCWCFWVLKREEAEADGDEAALSSFEELLWALYLGKDLTATPGDPDWIGSS